jgi:hypothetical protein
MSGEFEFQFPWLLALLGLLPVYALLCGQTGKLSALTFSATGQLSRRDRDAGH